MECRRWITGCSLQKFSERRALPLVGEIIPHRAQGGLFQPADLRLRDADFPGNLHLGLPLIETHADDLAFALIETGDRVLQGEAQDAATGAYSTTPGTAVLTVTGTV